MKGPSTLWILTEERPKRSALEEIISYFAKDNGIAYFGDTLRIIPLLDVHKCFDFTYEIIGFNSPRIEHIYLKTVSGSSSFTDYLVYYQDEQPDSSQTPLYCIEETKTDDSESRNTGVYQRCSKFVFLHHIYPKTKMLMLYSLQIEQKKIPTDTNIFGSRLLATLGVQILGKKLNREQIKPFTSIDELITFKNNMRRPKASSNVPILLTKTDDEIKISGRLYKSGSLSHDPNIGALSIISCVLRLLGWKGRITITHHGLRQNHVRNKKNKFILIANNENIGLEGLNIPQTEFPEQYWHYDTTGEKLGTIFIHIVVENFTESFSIFENHAGCEKGYFQTAEGVHIHLSKYYDRDLYKAGDKDQIIFIPDLVLLDIKEHETITIEGKKYQFRQNGINELAGYDAFDELYLKKYYPTYKIVRTVVLYGGTEERIVEVEVGFLLNENGKMILGFTAPKLFTRAINNLLSYWG